jgi:hypothetical protein
MKALAKTGLIVCGVLLSIGAAKAQSGNVPTLDELKQEEQRLRNTTIPYATSPSPGAASPGGTTSFDAQDQANKARAEDNLNQFLNLQTERKIEQQLR